MIVKRKFDGRRKKKEIIKSEFRSFVSCRVSVRVSGSSFRSKVLSMTKSFFGLGQKINSRFFELQLYPNLQTNKYALK